MKERHEELKGVAGALVDILSKAPPQVAQAMLGGFIASVIGSLPDPFWKIMLQEAQKPCGQPECDCEKFRVPVMNALDVLREDYKEQTLFGL